jgi:hypothetical protein
MPGITNVAGCSSRCPFVDRRSKTGVPKLADDCVSQGQVEATHEDVRIFPSIVAAVDGYYLTMSLRLRHDPRFLEPMACHV